MNYLKNEEEARDAVLEIFGNLPEWLEKYEIRNLANWLHTIIKNHCLKHPGKYPSGRHYSLQELPLSDYADEADEEINPVEIQKLDNALTRLNDPRRICIEMFYFEENFTGRSAQNGIYHGRRKKSYSEWKKKPQNNVVEVKEASKNTIWKKESGHLGRNELPGCAEGKITGNNLHRIEKHLLDCELCSDALDGMEKMGSGMRLARLLHEMHKSPVSSRHRRGKIFLLQPILALILILIIILISVLLYLKSAF